MAQKIDKAAVMRRAWRIYRSRVNGTNAYNLTFADSLSRAWYVEKETIRYNERLAEEAREREAAKKANELYWARVEAMRREDGRTYASDLYPEFAAAIAADYANAPKGTYFGD